MRNKIISLLFLQILFAPSCLSVSRAQEISAGVGRKLIELRWDVETGRSTAKSTLNYAQDYLKHLSQVQTARMRLSSELNIPGKEKELLEKIRQDLVTKSNSISSSTSKLVSKTLPGLDKSLQSISKERIKLKKQMKGEEEQDKSLLKKIIMVSKDLGALKIKILQANKRLLELKYEILNLEFADSIEKYSAEYKKFLAEKEKIKAKKNRTKKVKTEKPKVPHVKKTHSKKPTVAPAPLDSNLIVASSDRAKLKTNSIDWGVKLTREIDQELKKTSSELALLSDALTKELADLERLGMELFGARKIFGA